MNSELYSTKSACLAVGVFATILYLNTIGLGFCFDDDPAIVRNKDLRSSTPWTTLLQNDFWGTPMWKEGSHKSYRPLTVLTFRLNYAIHQLSSSGYHLVNAIIHGLASALFVTFSDVTFEKTSTSLMAGLVFAAHPIHTEAVAGLVGRAEGLCAIFFMLAFLAYVKAVKKNSTDWKLFLLCILFTILSVLCKELGVTVIGVCLAYDLLALQQASLPVLIQLAQSGQLWKRLRAFSARLAVILAAAMGIMALRLHIMKNIPTFLPFDNPAAFQSSPVRQLTNLYLVFVNAWLLLCPAGLLADWSMGTIPLVQGFSDQRNLLTLLTFTVLALIGFSAILGTRRRNRILVLAISILVIPFIPASNLFFSVGFTVAERILYIPSMGFSLLLGLAFENLLHRKITGKLVRVGFLGLLVLFSAKTFVRNYQWDSDFTIFSAALRVTQSNAKVYSNIGHYYQFRQQPELADKYFSQSVIVQPNDVGAWMNVAENSLVLKDRKRCIEAYRKARSLLPSLKAGSKQRFAPAHLKVFGKLANVLKTEESDHAEALKMFGEALAVDHNSVEAHIDYGEFLRDLGRLEDSRRILQKARALDNTNVVSNFNLGVLGLKEDRLQDAERYFKEVLEIDPVHAAALYNLGLLYHNTKRYSESIEYMKVLHSAVPGHIGAIFSLGVVHLDLNILPEALDYFNQTLQINSTHEDALFNIGLTLSSMRRYPAALDAAKVLLEHYPEHFKGALLMGDVNMHTGQYEEALKSYNAGLDIRPQATIALHNKAIALAHLERNVEAHALMKEVLALEPTYPNAQKNMKALKLKVENDRQKATV